jgi:DNA-binding Lrp family transcriptional regulator
MTTKKLSTAGLLRRVDAGESFAEIAKDAGVSRQAIQKRVRKLRGRTTKAIAVGKVEKIVDQKIDAVGQLSLINERALQLLDEAEDNPELRLKAMAEIRNQLRLQLEIYSTLYDLRAVAEFQDAVLTTISEVSPDVRERIIRKLNQRQAIRAAVRFA